MAEMLKMKRLTPNKQSWPNGPGSQCWNKAEAFNLAAKSCNACFQL